MIMKKAIWVIGGAAAVAYSLLAQTLFEEPDMATNPAKNPSAIELSRDSVHAATSAAGEMQRGSHRNQSAANPIVMLAPSSKKPQNSSKLRVPPLPNTRETPVPHDTEVDPGKVPEKLSYADCESDRSKCMGCVSYNLHMAGEGSQQDYVKALARASMCASRAHRPDLEYAIDRNLRAADNPDDFEPKDPIEKGFLMEQRGEDATGVYKEGLSLYLSLIKTRPGRAFVLLGDAYFCAAKLGDTSAMREIMPRLLREADSADPKAILMMKKKLQGYDAGRELDTFYSLKSGR